MNSDMITKLGVMLTTAILGYLKIINGLDVAVILIFILQGHTVRR